METLVNFKKHSSTFWIISAFLVLLTLVSMFPPQVEILRKGSEYAVQIMIFLLVVGMMFLALRQKELMFVSLACCGLMCLFLKNASNTNLIFPKPNNSPTLSIMHINLASIEGTSKDVMETVEKYNPDVISFQEVTPDWDFNLYKNLTKSYRYKYSMVRIDPYGKAIYSKFQFRDIDTLTFEKNPDIKINIQFKDEKIGIITTYLDPPLNTKSRIKSNNHLEYLADKIQEFNGLMIALGDFHHVYWSGTIRNFREATGLLNSRRNSNFTRFTLPYDHIFYSPQLECINFKEIEDKDFNHIGILGEYQVNSSKILAAESK